MKQGNNSQKKPTSFKFNYKEVAEALIKSKGIEEGIWSLGFVIAHKAGQVNDGKLVHPASFSIITEVTLSRVEEENNLMYSAMSSASALP